MSYVNVLIAKDDKLYLAGMHYRTVKKLLEGNIERVLPCLKSRFLDAGYVVVDLNRKVIINGQDAMAIGRIIKNSELMVIEA